MTNDTNVPNHEDLRPKVDAIIEELREVADQLAHLRDQDFEGMLLRKCTPIVIRPTADCERTLIDAGAVLGACDRHLGAAQLGVRALYDQIGLKSRSGTA